MIGIRDRKSNLANFSDGKKRTRKMLEDMITTWIINWRHLTLLLRQFALPDA